MKIFYLLNAWDISNTNEGILVVKPSEYLRLHDCVIEICKQAMYLAIIADSVVLCSIGIGKIAIIVMAFLK